MKYRLVIFDFDGTLADSFPFFVSVVNELAEQHNFKKIELDEIPALRHKSVKQMLSYAGLAKWKLPLLAKSFMALMNKNIKEVSLFDDTRETLLYLTNKGVTLSMVTSNSYANVCKILGPENVLLFTQFECRFSISGKQSRIRKVLRKNGIPNYKAIYIGDHSTDAEAARKEGVAFGAVSWGYGTIESLQEYSPDEIFESVSAIKNIV